ncbi:MAG: hypothetical protein IH605_16745 [Burkholderiales bacterium]|nr:hypothetical protein [Burkholderiales bacterium]
MFLWIGMWLSAALLPCSEVAAAVASRDHSSSYDCGQATGHMPDSGGGHKAATCVGITTPASASALKLAGMFGGNPLQPVLASFALSRLLPPLPAPARPVAYGAAPPPVAAFLHSSRLLI